MASKTCVRCGASADQSCNFCPNCGAPLNRVPPDTTSETKRSSSQARSADLPRNVAALLCYLLLFVTGILFLLIEPYSKDRFIRFHAFQAIFFFIALVVIQVVVNVLGLILVGVFPSPAGFVAQTLLQSSVMLGLLFLWILLMYKAYSHETFSLPVVGDLAARQA